MVSRASIVCGLGYVVSADLIFSVTGADVDSWAVRFTACVGAMTLGLYCSWLDADGR